MSHLNSLYLWERAGVRAIVQMAGHPALWFDLLEERDVDRTARHGERTTGMEHAARGRRQQGRRQSRDATEILFCVQVRQALDQQLGVGMKRVFEDAADRPDLRQLAAVHD